MFIATLSSWDDMTLSRTFCCQGRWLSLSDFGAMDGISLTTRQLTVVWLGTSNEMKRKAFIERHKTPSAVFLGQQDRVLSKRGPCGDTQSSSLAQLGEVPLTHALIQVCPFCSKNSLFRYEEKRQMVVCLIVINFFATNGLNSTA